MFYHRPTYESEPHTVSIVDYCCIAGGVMYLQEQTTPPPVKSEAQLLFGFQEADVRSLSLKTPEQNLSFVKNAAPNPATWQMTSPN